MTETYANGTNGSANGKGARRGAAKARVSLKSGQSLASQYQDALARIPEQSARFHRAALRIGDDSECTRAYREYCALVSRAIREGRIWDPFFVRLLAPILLAINLEVDHTLRQEDAFEEAGDDKTKYKKVQSSTIGFFPEKVGGVIEAAFKMTVDQLASRCGAKMLALQAFIAEAKKIPGLKRSTQDLLGDLDCDIDNNYGVNA
jgi:hypothetical protein